MTVTRIILISYKLLALVFHLYHQFLTDGWQRIMASGSKWSSNHAFGLRNGILTGKGIHSWQESMSEKPTHFLSCRALNILKDHFHSCSLCFRLHVYSTKPRGLSHSCILIHKKWHHMKFIFCNLTLNITFKLVIWRQTITQLFYIHMQK